MYVYVASSWKNMMHDILCSTLVAADIPHFNFKEPPGHHGFRWSEAFGEGHPEETTFEEYKMALSTDPAERGFTLDFGALCRATHTVLVLPCNRSAHLELGYAAGIGQATAIWFPPEEKVKPELMYKAVEFLTDSMMDLLEWLGVED